MPVNFSPFTLGPDLSQPTNVPLSVRTVNAFMGAHQPIHRSYTRQWFLNIANYVGNQNLVWDKTSGRFTVPPAPSWRVRMVINKILPLARTQMAKLLAIKPQPYVVPSTTEENDRNSASIGTKFLKNIKDSERFEEIYEDIVHWVVLTGNPWLFALYDEQAGREINVPVMDENGQPAINPVNGLPIIEKLFEGDVMLDVTDPFEIIPDYATTKSREMSGLVKQKIRSVDYVREKYGVTVGPERIGMDNQNMVRAMSQNTTSGARGDITKTLKNSVFVKEYYGAPTMKYPKGQHLIIANGMELSESVLDTKINGEYCIPGTLFGAIRVPKRLMYMSPIENILELQWEYNRARSQIIEDLRMMGRPKLFAPVDSITDGAVTDQPGEIVEYDADAGPPPFYATPTGPPQSALDNINRLDQEMQDIAGVHEISLGRLPRRATSGLALNTLEEKDNTIIGPIRDNIRRGLARTFSICLNIASERFSEKRKLKIVGEKNQNRLIDFSGSDLNSKDDVKVLIDDQFPQSRAAKLEFAQTLVKAQIISPQTARKIIDLDDFANLSDVLLDEEQQRIAAAQQAQLPPTPEQVAKEEASRVANDRADQAEE